MLPSIFSTAVYVPETSPLLVTVACMVAVSPVLISLGDMDKALVSNVAGNGVTTGVVVVMITGVVVVVPIGVVVVTTGLLVVVVVVVTTGVVVATTMGVVVTEVVVVVVCACATATFP